MRRVHICLKEGLAFDEIVNVMDAVEACNGTIISRNGNLLEVEVSQYRFAEKLHKFRYSLCKRPWQGGAGAGGSHYAESVELIDMEDSGFIRKAFFSFLTICEFVVNILKDKKSTPQAR